MYCEKMIRRLYGGSCFMHIRNISKERYYQKISRKTIENKDEIKPDAWDTALSFDKIPGFKPLPFIGNTWRFLPGGALYNVQLIDLHKRLYKKFGKLTYFSGIPGKRPVVFAYDPNDIEQTVRNEGPWPIRHLFPSFVHYRTRIRNDVFQGVGGALTVQDEDWFNFRSVVNKILMQPRIAEMYVSSMDNVANQLIANIRRFSETDPMREMPKSFQNELHKWALESMGVIAFNRRIGCLDPELDENSDGKKIIHAVVELFDLMYKLDILPSLWPYISTKNWRRYVKLLDILTDFNRQYIEECWTNCNSDPNIPDHELSVLERLTKCDKRIAFAMVSDMIIAGIDTTGRVMGSALYFLAKNPAVQTKLREELKVTIPTKTSPITKEMLKESPFLKAVIKETMRLSPTAVGILRTTVKDTVLSGYRIPKGTDILGVNILSCFDDKYFKKANEFIPDRWLRDVKNELSYKHVNQFISLPFGFGPRSCVGKRLANLELEVGIAKIIKNFKLSWNHPDATFGTSLLYGIIDPLKITVNEATN